MPDCGVHYLWFAFVCFLIRSPSPPPQQTPHGLGVCIWTHLVNGTGNSPSPGQLTPGVVKQDKPSRGSVDTTKPRSGPQRVRMSSGERPMVAAKGKQSDTEALRHPPPPPHARPAAPLHTPPEGVMVSPHTRGHRHQMTASLAPGVLHAGTQPLHYNNYYKHSDQRKGVLCA